METLCIGIGNTFRHDDGVGPYVARLLREQDCSGATIIAHDGEGGSLSELLTAANNVILIDAVISGAATGTLFQYAAHEHALPAHCFAHSTHAFGVAEAIELARVLGHLPRRCIVFGIEGVRFEPGIGLSPAVEQAARRLVPVIRCFIQNDWIGAAAAPI